MRKFLCSIMFSLGCAGKVYLPHAPIPENRTVLLHADTEFTERERAVIRIAAEYLREQTGARFVPVYDLDFGVGYQEKIHENMLIRMPVDSASVTVQDQAHSGTVYGWTVQASPLRIYLVAERMLDSMLFLHVTEHEFGHGIGANHLTDETAVMYEFTTPGKYEAVKFSDSDREEIKRALSK